MPVMVSIRVPHGAFPIGKQSLKKCPRQEEPKAMERTDY